jgi:hypothetical protein
MRKIRTASTKSRSSGWSAGLNYDAGLSAQGETGFVDPKGAYHNPVMPADRDPERPQVVMTLSNSAFQFGKAVLREKAYSVATLRHEMRHATSAELAIGWLLRWRDDFADLLFDQWLASEKTLSGPDRALVFSYIDKSSIAPTELLAWTEGFVTALPFLPASPTLDLLKDKDRWPAAVSELEGAGKLYDLQRSDPVGKAALARIHRVVCSVLTPDQRTTMIKWLKALLDPKSLGPTDADKKTVTLISTGVGSQTAWLKDVLEQATKSCLK